MTTASTQATTIDPPLGQASAPTAHPPSQEPASQPPAASPAVTPEEYEHLDDTGAIYELVDGQLWEKNMSDTTMLLANQLKKKLDVWSSTSDVGESFVEARFRCFSWDKNLIRIPDMAFITAERFSTYELGQPYFTIVPDLAIEVVSPRDEANALQRKIDEYQRAGVKRVWVIYPEQKLVRIHGAPGEVAELVGEVELTDEQLLPGFTCPLKQLFAASQARR